MTAQAVLGVLESAEFRGTAMDGGTVVGKAGCSCCKDNEWWPIRQLLDGVWLATGRL